MARNTNTTILLMLFMFFSFSALGFENEYLHFDLPTSWACEQEKTSWICSPQSPEDTREAIVVISAKAAGQEDNMQLFMRHLSRPKMLLNEQTRASMPSKVYHTKLRMIGPQQWVEGLHLGSEIKDFFTLYLATKSQGLSILLSLSADRSHTNKYNQTFANLVNSIRIKKLSFKSRLSQNTRTGVDSIDEAVATAVQDAPSTYSLLDTLLSSRVFTAISFAFLAILAAIGFYARSG